MKIVLQRVASAQVEVGGEIVGRCGRGYLILLGVARGDGPEAPRRLAEKIAALRLFEDPPGKMNRSLAEVGGEVLAVPQFTLLADCSRGRRPDFTPAEAPGPARALFEQFCSDLRDLGVAVAAGAFGESMQVTLVNDGPVTIILEA